MSVGPGRNDACPCGSGRKYKRCCEPTDRERRRLVKLVPDGAADQQLTVDRAAIGPTWEADMVPLPIAIDAMPDGRPVAVLVASNGLVLKVDVLEDGTAHADEIAGHIVRVVRETIDAVGGTPRVLRIRHAEVCAEVRRLQAGSGLRVEHADWLPWVSDAAMHLAASLLGGGGDGAIAPLVSRPARWAGWRVAPGVVGGFFTAAAEYYRNAPWDIVPDDHLVTVLAPTGAWFAIALGQAGITTGLALYRSASDIASIIDGDGVGIVGFRDTVLAVTFDHRRDVARVTRDEIKHHRWEIAGPGAYPEVQVFNTPGGGLTAETMTDWATILEAFGRWARSVRQTTESAAGDDGPSDIVWTDSESGLTLAFPVAPALWDPPGVLQQSGPVGPSAEPGAALPFSLEAGVAGVDSARIWGFRDHLVAQGLSAATVDKHERIVQTFVDHLAMQQVPLAACTEFDLRQFLYDSVPRGLSLPASSMRAAPGSLKRFVDYLAAHEGIRYPWAGEILKDHGTLAIRIEECPGGPFWDEDLRAWRQELYDDLDARVLLPDAQLGLDDEWGATMGLEELRLHNALQREWLAWRDDVIRAGTTAPGAVRDVLSARQRQWEVTPHPGCGGDTPVSAVAKERTSRR